MHDRDEYLTWALFFIAGGLAGAGAALLLAPQAGRDTRGRVGRRLRRAGRSARDFGESVVRRGEELGGIAARRVEEASAVLGGNSGEPSAAPGNPAHSR
jgi:gas vesicle protein